MYLSRLPANAKEVLKRPNPKSMHELEYELLTAADETRAEDVARLREEILQRRTRPVNTPNKRDA